MLPTIKRPRPKEETDLAVLLQSNIELQKTMIQKAEQRNATSLKLIAQSFQELRSECANISALMEKMVKLQMHAVKTQKSSLTELKDLNKGSHSSEKGDFTCRQNQSVAVSQVHESSEEKQLLKFPGREYLHSQFHPQKRKSERHQRKQKSGGESDQCQLPKIPEIEKTMTKTQILKISSSKNVDKASELKQQTSISDPNIQSEQLILIKNNPSLLKLLDKQSVQLTQKKTQQTKITQFPQCLSVVPFQQKSIIIDLGQFVQKLGKGYPNFDDFKCCMSEWMGVLYNQITKKSFSGYFSRYFNHDQTKVYFTKNLIVNFVRATELIESEFKSLWNERSVKLIEHFEKQSAQILQYTALKFPQQQKSYVSSEVSTALPNLDQSSDPKLDYLYNTGLLFPAVVQQQESCFRHIKIFLNKILQLTDKNRPQWSSMMKDLFTIDGKEVHNQIGAKFKQNTPKFQWEDIQKFGITIKAPEVLRVIVKWTEELEKKCIDLDSRNHITWYLS